MIAFYARVSTLQQKTDRQLVSTEGMKVFEDRCSGSVPFAERPSGRRVIDTMVAGDLEELVVHSLDRLGRDLLDILRTIELFTDHAVPIRIEKEHLTTLDPDGRQNPTSRLVISVLGVVAEMERAQIRERQLEGIALAKARGAYVGRRPGSVEGRAKFLAKPRIRQIADYLQRGYRGVEIRKIVGCSPNTISKVRRLTMGEAKGERYAC